MSLQVYESMSLWVYESMSLWVYTPNVGCDKLVYHPNKLVYNLVD